MPTRARTLSATEAATLLVAALLLFSTGTALATHSTGVHEASDLGVVTIRADGSISNSAAPISQSGNDYRLTGPLNGSLVVLRSDAAVNGSGFLIDYTNVGGVGDGAAVTVDSASGVTISDFLSENDSVGLRADATSDLTVTYDQVTGSTAAVNITNSTIALVSDNSLLGGSGIQLVNVTGSTVASNGMNGSSPGILEFGGADASVSDNYLANVPVHSNAILLDGVTGASVASNDLPSAAQGVNVSDSRNVTITGNNASLDSSVSGITLNRDTGVTVTENQLGGDWYGAEVQNSTAVVLSHNEANDSRNGIAVVDSAGVTVDDNYVERASTGVDLESSADVQARGNEANGSFYGFLATDCNEVSFNDNNGSFATGIGFGAGRSDNVQIVGNVAFHSGLAIEGYHSFDTLVANNSANDSMEGVVDFFDSGLMANGNTLDRDQIALYSEGSAGSSFSDDEGLSSTTDGAFFQADTGEATLTGSDLANSDGSGVSLYMNYASVTIAGDDLANSNTNGVESTGDNGSVIITDNTLTGSNNGVYVSGDFSQDTIAQNQMQNCSGDGLDLLEPVGPVAVVGNNASGSGFGLFETGAVSLENLLVGNDFANTSEVFLDDSTLTEMTDNDLLDVPSIQILNTSVDVVDHNDFDSSGFVSTASTTGEGSWNAPYPVGGNYWSGYAGVDQRSGPAQNIPGPDGIGDTPYSVSTATDAYPLMHPWVGATVSFEETGLPVGSLWSATLNGTSEEGVAGVPIAFVQTNGAFTPFAYQVAAGPTYAASPPAGTGVENGVDQVVRISFEPVLFAVTFNESTLPAGTMWTVSVNGVAVSTTNSSLTFEETNGSYRYEVAPIPGVTASPSTGSLTVAGANQSLSIDFAVVTYSVVFVETGLPSGTSWSVTLGGSTLSSTSSQVTFIEPNGTYSFTVTLPSGYSATPSRLDLTVAGSGTTVFLAVTASSSGSSPTPSPLGGSAGSTWLIVLLVAVAVVALVGWFLYFWGRRRSGTGATEGSPAANEGSPPHPPA